MLLNQDGAAINFRTLLSSGKPLIIDFISTRCLSICPGLSQGLSDLRKKLGASSGSVQFISISTDPDTDGPDQMKAYLAKYNTGAGWDFLTGRRSDIVLLLKAFDASAGDKLSPRPFYYLHDPNSDDWIRVNLAAGTPALLREIRRVEAEGEAPRSGVAAQKAAR